MHRSKRKSLAEQFATLDEPVAAEATTTEPLQLLDESERPAIEWPAEERRKRNMPTIALVFLVMACLCFILAGFNATPASRVNPIGLGLFFWTLSLIIRFVP